MNTNEEQKYPEGHFVGKWMGIGIAIFSGIGIPLSVITKQFAFIGIGPALGVSVGLAIGQAVENKYKKENKIRPLTEAETKRKKIAVFAGIAILILGCAAFLLTFLTAS